jgi:hypothetical protein
MENKGFEFSVSSKNLVNELKWNTDFNISFNRNKITNLPGGSIYGGYVRTGYTTIAQQGQPLGSFYGYVSQGVDPATGMMKYKDIDGDGQLSDGDKTIIGNANPKYSFGIANDFKYKNWSLNIFIQSVQGNQIFNASRIETEGMSMALNQLTTVLNRWTTPGQITNMPKSDFNGDYNIQPSSRYVEDGSYVRLKSVTLGYSLPDSLISKINISKARFYCTAENLFTWTKYSGLDPEVNVFKGDNVSPGVDYGVYPQTRDILFGLNLSF